MAHITSGNTLSIKDRITEGKICEQKEKYAEEEHLNLNHILKNSEFLIVFRIKKFENLIPYSSQFSCIGFLEKKNR